MAFFFCSESTHWLGEGGFVPEIADRIGASSPNVVVFSFYEEELIMSTL